VCINRKNELKKWEDVLRVNLTCEKNVIFVWVFWQVLKNRTYIGKSFTRETLYIQEDHSLNSRQFENIEYRIALMFVLSQRQSEWE